jgi:branched-chain amino acid transport system permease protein
MQFLVAIVAVALLCAIWYTDRNERVNRRVPVVLQVVLVVWVAIAPFWFGNADQFIDVSTQALAYVVMALGLNIVVGFAGLLDLGYVAFFAFGAYTIGWFSSSFIVKAHIHIGSAGTLAALPGVHLNFLLILLVAMVICAVAGVLIGLPTLRLRGDYIAIVTLGFGEIIRVFATNGDGIKIFGQQLTAGRQGITPVDPVKLPLASQFDQLHLRPWYWTVLVMVLVALFVNVRLRDSRLGRAWIAVREDEVAAASMGVPLVRTKLLSYATGAAFGGMAGAFLGAYLSTVNADQFQFSFSILILAMVILGGLGSIWGVVLGALALAYLNTYLIPNVFRDLPHHLGFNFDLTDVSFGIFGFVLVMMMLLRPEGLLPERRRQLEMEEGVGTGADIYEVKA